MNITKNKEIENTDIQNIENTDIENNNNNGPSGEMKYVRGIRGLGDKELKTIMDKINKLQEYIVQRREYSQCCVLSHSAVSDSLRSMDCNLPGFSVHGTLQARILEWVTMPSSSGSFQARDRTQVSHIVGRFFTFLSHQGSPNIASILQQL